MAYDSDPHSAALLTAVGGPEVLVLGEAPPPALGPGQVLVRNHAAGVNAIDLLIRRGELPPAIMPSLPHVLGVEGAGVVEAVAADVTSVAVGDRVLWFGFLGAGGYGSLTSIDARYVARLEDRVDFVAAAASPVIYTTALHMLEDYRKLKPGDWILVRSAAGGVGVAALQLARRMGLRPIAVTSAEKLDFVRAQGAEAAVDYRADDVPARVRALTGEAGIALSLNPVGGGTVAEDLDLLQPLGQVVIFGFLGGLPQDRISDALVPHFNKSVGLHVSDVYTFYFTDPAGITARLETIARALAAAELQPPVLQIFPLAAAGEAHAVLESGEAKGKLVLVHPQGSVA